jgi:hypothetical protein
MALTYRQCQEYRSPPITPTVDERDPVPLSPITEPSTGGSSMDHSPADPTFKESPQPLEPLTHSEDSERNCISTLQKPDPMKPVRDNQAMMYLVSFLHALPFIYRIGSPPTMDGAPHFPGPRELQAIAVELGLREYNRRITIPVPLNPLPISIRCAHFCATINHSEVLSHYTSMALTLISALYPSHYGWNRLGELPISPTTPISPTLASKSALNTEAYYYLQLSDGIILQKGDIYHVYQDKSYIPSRTRQIPDNNIDYPYGWSAGIEEYCQLFGHHLDCTDPIRCAFIEREFVNYTINDPNRFEALDNYLNIIYANSLGRNLQWLFSSNTPVPDDLQQRTEITNLYAQIDNQEGSIYHTKHGLRITIPEEKWINWKTFSPTSQSEFTRAAWAQLTQFDKMALMTGLKEGKLDKKPIYIDFGDNAKHDQFWQTEFDSVRQYYIELITQMGTFHSFNQYVVQDLAYNNEPLDIDLNTNWEMEDRPRFIFLPYSKLMVRWNGKQHQWEIEEHSTNSLSSGSSYTRSSQGSMMSTSPFNDPIDEFEMVDRDMD